MARARRLCLCIALALALGSPAARAASAAGGTALDRYLNGLETLSANFTQSVTDSHGTLVGAGSGRLLVQRPGKFRWDYVPDSKLSQTAGTGQVLVADGTNLWFYDRELAQVSVKPVAAALSATPVMLLSGTAAQLHESFDISPAGSHDGLDWVSVQPRSAEADFSHAELGFAGEQLLRMVVKDRLGQTVQLDFQRSERNGRVDPSELQFKPPAGVDVIGTPQS